MKKYYTHFINKVWKTKYNIVVLTLGALVNLILDYKRPWILCLALQHGQKSSMIWSGFKIEVTKNILKKNVLLKSYSLTETKFRKIQMIFDIENSLWKSHFRTLRWAGKASQDGYNPGGWLIL